MTNTSRRNFRKTLPAVFALALALASCSSSEDTEPTETSSTATTIPTSTTSNSAAPTSTSSSTVSTATETETEPPELVEPNPAVEETPAEPVIQQESIWNSPGVGYQCPGTDAFTNDPANCTSANLGGDPSYDQMYPGGYPAAEVPYADGGHCAAAICGYGHDENGNPNPSSGELQTMDGCEVGYITDQDLCSQVFEKANQYGW